MGLDLKILPAYSQTANFSQDLISLDRDSELFELIMNLEKEKGREVAKRGVSTYTGRSDDYEDVCYGKTIEHAYGEIMKGVLASELKEALSSYKFDFWKNKAFYAFINELPDDLEIWLYWH